MTGVHGLQHVYGFGSTHLAHDDPVGAHAQGIDQQVPLVHFARALHVRRPGLQADHVGLPELKLRGVLDRDDALRGRNRLGQHVEKSRLTRAGTAGHQDIQSRFNDRFEHFGDRLRQRTKFDQILDREQFDREAANRQRWAIDCKRRNDGVDTRAVLESRIDHR